MVHAMVDHRRNGSSDQFSSVSKCESWSNVAAFMLLQIASGAGVFNILEETSTDMLHITASKYTNQVELEHLLTWGPALGGWVIGIPKRQP
ncbi:hypothetical protein EMCG_05787 [[Emmonsia] crescens]|uniref:Uncharacterized protein n=1 Tax=[Emmonsia] crescens TaxID=73230 RepID=A0A0G2IE90_9EURO|nr:hypothetical protein EMCG_05787 [Emmonsia crescens UAMH 3008]